MTRYKWPNTPEQKAKAASNHKRWRLVNKDKVRANYRRWYHKNLERAQEESRERYANRSERVARLERNSHYKSRYGITLEDYERILIAQKGRCVICGSDKAGNVGQCFAVDHCHETGKVRGLLCIKCNAYLGWFEDHSSWLRANRDTIEAYLNK